MSDPCILHDCNDLMYYITQELNCLDVDPVVAPISAQVPDQNGQVKYCRIDALNLIRLCMSSEGKSLKYAYIMCLLVILGADLCPFNSCNECDPRKTECAQ